MAGFLVLALAVLVGRQDLLVVGVLLVALPAAALVSLRLAGSLPPPQLSVDPPAVPVGGTAVLTIVSGAGSAAPAEAGAWGTMRRLSTAPQAAPRAAPWRFVMPDGLEDLGPAGAAADGAGGGGRITGRGTRRLIRASRRGDYSIGPLFLEVTDRFGLARRRLCADGRGRVLVLPEPARLSWPVTMPPGVRENASRSGRGVGGPLEGTTARPYLPGDPIRRMQWRATARFGKLMVRQEEERRRPEVWLYVDTRGRPGTAKRVRSAYAYDDESFELLVRAVAAAASFSAARRCDLHVVEAGARQLFGERPGGGHASYSAARAHTLLPRELATLHPAARGEPEAALFRLTAALRRPGALVVALRPECDDLVGVLGAARPGGAATGTVVAAGPLGPAVRARLLAAGWRIADVARGRAGRRVAS
ncbi:MAG TPA: DUF58 domain-containing protein [Microbacteriaceae bacterium]|nr:DUF58 domain-containing protein [Microbacteriaceae bacterium]